jgi:hypothetical protein
MNTIEPSGGHVVLRGHKIEVDSDIGRAFAIDCCRFIEGLITEEALRKKYGLHTDAQWRELSDIEPLQLLIGKLKEERVRSGEAQREKAAQHWLNAVDVVGAIVADPTAPSRARLDGARELRTTVQGTQDSNKSNERERFVININFGGGNVLRKTVDLQPVKPEREPLMIEDDMPEPRPTGLADYAIRSTAE